MVIKLLFQIIKIKLYFLFDIKKNISGLITTFSLIIASIIYANLIGHLFNNNEIIIDNFEMIATGLLILFSILTIIRKLFPNFQAANNIIQPFHPISGITKYFVNISSDFFSVFFINIVFFFFLIYIRSEYFDKLFMLKAIYTIIASIIIRRTIQLMTEQKLSSIKPKIILLLMLFMNFIIIVQSKYIIFLIIIGILSIIILGYTLEELMKSDKKDKLLLINSNMWLNIVKSNKASRISLIFGIIFKSLLLFIITLHFIKRQKYPEPIFIVYLFLLPTMLFTYLFNNIWGVNRNLWLCIDMSGINWNKTIVFVLNMIKPFFIIDFIISITFLMFNPQLLVKGLLSYSLSFIILIIFSIYWSVMFPILIKKTSTFALKTSTSVFASIVTILIVISFSFLDFSYMFIILPVLFLILSILLYFYLNKTYQKYRLKIYEKLFKN
jgi:hypothetical protein